MANDSVSITFPPGRYIMGDLYDGSDKDAKGQPRLVKTGPNKGQPFTQWFVGVAIPKAGEQAWWQTPWGQQIMAVGAAAFPNFYQNPAFAWKIEDGDSAIPNKAGKRPCDAEGAKGHWILKFSSGFAPKVYQQPSPGAFVDITPQKGLIKRGFWVQVSGSVAGNGSSESPGVYLNSGMALFVRTDAEITVGPDAATAFAGATVSQALPTALGASAPFAGAAPALPTAGAPQMPTAGAPQMPMAGAAMQPQAPLAVQPNPAFLAVPGGAPAMPGAVAPGMPMAPALPAAPVAPQMPAAPQMTPKGAASGFTYEQYRASNWTDDQLRANGLIV